MTSIMKTQKVMAKEIADLRVKFAAESMIAAQTIASLEHENRQLRRRLKDQSAFISRLANTIRAAFTECFDHGGLLIQEDVSKDSGTEEIIRIYQDDNISAFDHGNVI